MTDCTNETYAAWAARNPATRMPEWPTNPADCRVIADRSDNGAGPIHTLRVGQVHGVVLATYTDAWVDNLLDEARAYGRYAPDAMPSDEHLVLAAMAQHGITPDEDGEPEPDASGIEGSVPDAFAQYAPMENLALLQEAADALRDLKRRGGIVTIGRGACIETRLRWAISNAKREG
jgi:hypothetical protein